MTLPRGEGRCSARPRPAGRPCRPASRRPTGAEEGARGDQVPCRRRCRSRPRFSTRTSGRIDLGTALRLANVENPELNLARQLVIEASALRMLAAAQIIPTFNAGANYDGHQGVLQQSNGNMLSVNRSAVYVGAGANAVAAGTVNIPGLVLTGNIAQGVYGFLTSRQVVRQRAFASLLAVRNQTFLRVTLAYSELIRAEGGLAVALQNRDEAREVARLTAEYSVTGEGRKADADRAATQLARRQAMVQEAEGQVVVASASLCRELNLDPSLRLHPTDAFVVPMPIVPDPMPLPAPGFIALGLLNRPELAERQAAIRAAADAARRLAVLLPFSPTVLVGLSAGGFGGGSNLVRPVFGGFGGRGDVDVVAYWTLQNLGAGNLALMRTAKDELLAQRYREIGMLNVVRAEVAQAYARSHARFAQIGTYEAAVRSGVDGFREDFVRIRERGERTALPIELLNNFDLLADARRSYLDAIVDYNRSQFELFVRARAAASRVAGPCRADGGHRPVRHPRRRPPRTPAMAPAARRESLPPPTRRPRRGSRSGLSPTSRPSDATRR